jgi:hypothetical protein
MDDDCGARRLNQYMGFLADINLDGYRDTNEDEQRERKQAWRDIGRDANRKSGRKNIKNEEDGQELVRFRVVDCLPDDPCTYMFSKWMYDYI